MMEDLLSRVRLYVRRHGLLSDGESVVAAVSGGPDSLCMLHLLTRLASEFNLHLVVAHLDHGLRGSESGADARFVADTAASLGLLCVVETADVNGLAAMSGLSPEEAARQVRYRFLALVAEERGATKVAVGHNADDQAETVLMHFLRGSGIAGLRGMLPQAPLAGYPIWQPREDGVPTASAPGSQSPLRLVRPLLATRRAEIEAYCEEHDLAPRFDRSNQDVTIFRNRLRHELLPVLADYNPEIGAVLARTAEVMAADHEVVQGCVEQVWPELLLVSPPGEIRLSLDRWRSLSAGLQHGVLREAIRRLRQNLRDLGWMHVNRAARLAREGETGQAVPLVAGLCLQLGYGEMRIGGSVAPETSDVPQVSAPIPLSAPASIGLAGGWQVNAHPLSRAELPDDYRENADCWTAWLDAASLGARPFLRPRLPGDRFQPLGMSGHTVQVGEYMINCKVPRHVRAGWPVLEGQQGIAWLCGLRVDQRAAVGPATSCIWRVRVERVA